MKAAIYARVSTEDQEKEGTSLESQTEACLKLASEKSYDVPQHLIFKETFSGLTMERPQLIKLRQNAKNGELDAIIIHTPDRLARVGEDILLLAKEFTLKGIKLLFVKEQWDDSITGKLVAFMLGWASEFEAAQIRERTMRGKREFLRRGLLPQGTGRGLYGYKWDKKEKKRVIQEFEARVVQRLFEMTAEGFDSYTVAKQLNDHEIPTKSGVKWHPLTVKRMVTNPAYIGLTFFGRTRRIHNNRGGKPRLECRPPEEWKLLPDVTPPIIGKELFDKAQKALQRPKLRTGKPLHDYLLTGYAVCGYCGSRLIGTCLNHHYRYYRCRGAYPTATRPQICHASYIKADVAENLVWERVREVLEKPEVILQEVQQRKQANDFTSLEQEIVQKERELENNINAEHRLINLLRQGEVDTDYVLDQISGIKRERKEIEERLSHLTKLQEENQSLENAEIKLDEFCSRVRYNLDYCSFEDKRLALDALAIKVKATRERIEIEGVVPLKFSPTEQTWA